MPCRLLAPYLAKHCLDLGLVRVSSDPGGSMGSVHHEVIYGIITDPPTKEVLVIPLVNFDSLNDALNYINKLATAPFVLSPATAGTRCISADPCHLR